MMTPGEQKCRYGRVQSVKLLPRNSGKDDETGSVSGGGYCAAVAFMDIKSAAKAHASENSLDDRCLVTDYYEPLLGDHGGRTPGSSSTTAAGLGSNTPNSSNSGGGGGGGGSSRSSHLINSNNSSGGGGGSGGYDRPSSHYFERRGDPDGSGSFLRRQGPVSHHYRERPYRSSNGPFVRDGGGDRSSGHFRSAGPGSAGGPSPNSWNSYEPAGPPSSRYPPPDYGGMDERSERMSTADLLPSTPSTGKRTASSTALSAGLSTSSVNNTPLSARKRKSRYAIYLLNHIHNSSRQLPR